MSAMSVSLGLGFAPETAEREPRVGGPQTTAVPVQESAMGMSKLDTLTINELLFQALFGDLSQFC